MPPRKRNLPLKLSSIALASNRRVIKKEQKWLCAISVALIVCLLMFTIKTFTTPSSRSVPYIIDGQVEITHWTPDSPFAEVVAVAGEPVILRNTVVENWRARKMWKPSYLREKIKQLDGIYENDNRWFGPYYDVRRPLANLSDPINLYKTNLSMTGLELFQRLLSPDGNSFLYFSGEIERLGKWALADVMPLDELLILNPHSTSVNVWIGQPHVIAHCHYDGYHNMFVQLFGEKKFTLFRPSQWLNLYPYPFLHPSHAQSQVNLSDADLKRFPGVQQAHALEAVLFPGDILYMPPLWFHHVEALDVSISINVWTDSVQSLEVQKMFEVPIPIHHVLLEKKSDLHLLAIISLIKKIINETNKHKLTVNAQIFLRNLYDGRYHNLAISGLFRSSQWPWGDQSICNQLQDSTYASGLQAVFRETDALEDYVSFISNQVKRLPSDTRELWLGNFVESLIESVATAPFVARLLNESLYCLHEL
jgi:hypothetical protein